MIKRLFGKLYSIGEYEWPVDTSKWSYSDLEANNLYPHIIKVMAPWTPPLGKK